jgi:hypothetical protein
VIFLAVLYNVLLLLVDLRILRRVRERGTARAAALGLALTVGPLSFSPRSWALAASAPSASSPTESAPRLRFLRRPELVVIDLVPSSSS